MIQFQNLIFDFYFFNLINKKYFETIIAKRLSSVLNYNQEIKSLIV